MSSNRVKAITVYQAADGQNYETMGHAQQMSAKHIAHSKITALLQKRAIAGGLTINNLAADLLTNPEFAQQFRSAINSAIDFQRRYGKLNKKEKTATATDKS
jgi:hypothetical protein